MQSNLGVVEMDRQEMVEANGGIIIVIPLTYLLGAAAGAVLTGAAAGWLLASTQDKTN